MNERKVIKEQLTVALGRVEHAKSCIAENRGHEKEQAREGYESAVDDLATEVTSAVEEVFEDLPPASIVAIAKVLLRELNKEEG
jgi:hypothetical protein